MCLLHLTKSYFLLNCFLLPSVAVRILFGWDSVCVEISHRFLPSPNTNTRMRKTQRILQKQYVVPKTWNDMAVLLKNFSPDFFGKRFIYNFCFSLFLSVWEAIKLDVFWEYFTDCFDLVNNEIHGWNVGEKFESKILFTSLCLFELCKICTTRCFVPLVAHHSYYSYR